MYVELKKQYIVMQSPVAPLLIDVEEETHSILSALECALLNFLDGTKTQQEIINMLTCDDDLTPAEKGAILDSLERFFIKFEDVVEYRKDSSKRRQILFGSNQAVFPYTISLELTNKCVMECIHCYKEASPSKSSFVNYYDLKEFLLKMSNIVYSVQITGGEAMLHPFFWDILELCKTHFVETKVSTTGTLINANNVNLFKGTHVYLSIYSFDRVRNKEYIQKDFFDKILATTKLLVTAGVHTCINTIACDQNIDRIPDFIDKCEKLGVNGVGIGRVVRVGRGKNLSPCEMCSVKCEAAVENIEKTFSSPRMYLSTFANSSVPSELHCGFYKWIVNEHGQILPCAFFPSDKFAIGSITDPIENLFTNDKFSNMKSRLSLWAEELHEAGIEIEEVCPTLCLVRNGKGNRVF